MAPIVTAVAALLWPIFAFTLLVMFRKEIRRLVGRIKRGKFLGQEIELEEDFAKLQLSADAAVLEVKALPAPSVQLAQLPVAESSQPEERILEEAGRSPKAALLLLASELEREVRDVVASLGLLQGRTFITMREGLETLTRREALPRHLTDSVRLFWKVRNQLVHGHHASDDDVFRAIDLGNTILKAIRAIPHEINVVHNPGVDLFRDPGLTQLVDGAKGVVLETETSDRSKKILRVYPSTRRHFRKGMRVSWEWSPEHVFDELWYRDPETGNSTLAWSSSMEFVGRDLDAL